jgi:hypothetical protein
MIILHQRDSAPLADSLAALPRIPRDDGGPIFAEPWQAEAFALADELNAAATRGEPDDGSRYYHCWLTALEQLVVAKRLSDRATLLARKEALAEAYRRTPHGKPVELESEPSA